jgi:hypothetical protein
LGFGLSPEAESLESKTYAIADFFSPSNCRERFSLRSPRVSDVSVMGRPGIVRNCWNATWQ